MTGWQIWIDRGGTFTDLVARAPDGRLETEKLLSHAPELYADAALEGIRRLVARAPGPVDEVRMGTTVATNAALEGRFAPTLLAITAGHADALAIGHQARPDIFALEIETAPPVAAEVLEVDERLAADGSVLRPLDEALVTAALEAAHARGLGSLAVAFLHGWANPAHEQAVAAIARRIGFSVVCSHETGRLIRFVPRGQTALVEAALQPELQAHVARVEAGLAGTRLAFMQSSGTLAAAGHFRARNALLSGPAGGLVGMVASARGAGHQGLLIGFDMGGTSTDVSLWNGSFARAEETVVAGLRVRAAALGIDTVAAGGGSVVRADGGRLRVGPQSAGARPGPAAYGQGGPLTITDCNVALGRLHPDHFPAVFGADGRARLDARPVDARLAALARELDADPLDLAEGAIAIAVEAMAGAIRAISVGRGIEASAAMLVGFGGAGGQHVCAVADRLGIDRVLLPPLAGLLSALGIGMAEHAARREQTLGRRLAGLNDAELAHAADALSADARAALAAQGASASAVRLSARLRHHASDSTTELPLAPLATMAGRFIAGEAARFGLHHQPADLVLESLAAEAVAEQSAAPPAPLPSEPGTETVHSVRFSGQWLETRFVPRAGLAPGSRITGPAVLVEAAGTSLVAPGWQAEIDPQLNLLLSRIAPPDRPRAGIERDPVWLELFANRFMGIAEAMGAALRSTAWSVNIRERLDYSCAVFDAAGALIANAPHMPVHLGSMGVSVQAVIARHAAGFAPGNAYMLNDPWAGGTHLPDVTVVAPVFLDGEARPRFFVAARGHQADIGGTTPGSMPPDSRRIEDEGLCITDWMLARAGHLRQAETLELLAGVRDPQRSMGDLAAQHAACVAGAEALRALAMEAGADVVSAYMAHLQDEAEAAVRRALAGLEGGHFEAAMDNGATIRLALRIDREAGEAVLDFSGTSNATPDNFNAPEAVTRAAALYAVRALAGGDLPLNDGCMRPLRLVLPKGSILSPPPGAAVVAGNVETSQIVTDVILAAMGRLAASQGTMNNLSFGNARHQYYETIAGGAGAGPHAAGASAVQTHMTNSRLTDPEVLETRLPVRVERFAIRRGSGGDGRHRGGDGVERTLVALEPMTFSLLAGRRTHPPFGLAGGGDAMPGDGHVTRADGSRTRIAACARVELEAGDSITILTPGGGGWGQP